MAAPARVVEALSVLSQAIEKLDAAVAHRVTGPADDGETARLRADAERMRSEIAALTLRSDRLAQTNREVSLRLVTAMEAIRTVLDVGHDDGADAPGAD